MQKISAQTYANIFYLMKVFERQLLPITEQMVREEFSRMFGHTSKSKMPPHIEILFQWWKNRNSAKNKDEVEPEFPFDVERTPDCSIPPGRLSEVLLGQLKELQADGVESSSEAKQGDAATRSSAAKKVKVEVSIAQKGKGKMEMAGKDGEEGDNADSVLVCWSSTNSEGEGEDEEEDENESYNAALQMVSPGVREGSSPEHPVAETYSFATEWETALLKPRAITNFRFVDKNGSDISVSTGHYGENRQIWALGVAASANKGYDSGQRIMAGWWNTDDVTRTRSPMEMVWMKVRVNRIRDTILPWYRGGRTKILCIEGVRGEYVLQAPLPEYAQRWAACKLPHDYLFKGVVVTSNRVPVWMDELYYREMQEDVARWCRFKKCIAPPPAKVLSTKSATLQAQGKKADLEAKVRSLGPKLSASVDKLQKLHDQVMAHPIPKTSKDKVSFEYLLAKKNQEGLKVRSLFDEQKELKSMAMEVVSIDDEQHEPGDSTSPPAQYVVESDDHAGPSELDRSLTAVEETLGRDTALAHIYSPQELSAFDVDTDMNDAALPTSAQPPRASPGLPSESPSPSSSQHRESLSPGMPRSGAGPLGDIPFETTIE